MMRRPHPTRIGLFAILGLALLVAAVVTVGGGRLFAQRERAVLYFDGSIYGLQLGASVVFRGVRLGSVTSIGVVHDGGGRRFELPVTVEIDHRLIRDAASGDPSPLSLKDLVDRGLAAQLATQSLLTGLLYVDLDLRPGAARRVASAAAGGPVEIPTLRSPMQGLQQQLEQVDVARLAADLSAVAATARKLVTDPKVAQAVDDLAQTAADLRRVVGRVERRVDPLADAAQAALAEARRSAAQAGAAAERVAASADRWGGAADQVAAAASGAGTLIASGTPALAAIRRSADELARSATALRSSLGEESPLQLNLERAAQDVSRASRAVRDLADLLERQPESLIRGRGNAP